ncbi:MAG: hypothetical protein GWM93_19295, partial [Gemmatimonadetes bacterium]|nr:hypothetical protein [Gemmatimonadota bacterium]NIT68796.1 hypothetical protein [Gemmatimonadota bacterium]NIY37373.1 hypothetical protein [Gemmatimonadota bacterium]
MAGAGVALPQDSLIAATNPAGMVHVGERIDVGVSLFSPMREYEASSASAATGFFTVGPNTDPTFANTGTVAAQSKESENEAFLVPQFGWNKMLTPDSSIGVSVYGNGGMNTQYDGGFGTFNFTFFGFPPGPGSAPSFPGTFGGGQPGTPGGSTAGVDLSQLFVAPTYSRKFAGGKASWGVSAILAYQLFEARGLGAFAPFSTNPNKLTDNNHDSSFGAGARLGIMAELSPQLTVGASYQTPIWMDEFGEYEGLFAEQGGFDIPQNATLGLAWRP